MCKGIFITATGTDVGKTYISALLLSKLRNSGINAGYYKPVLSGAEYVNGELIPGDAAYVCQKGGLPVEPMNLVSYIYQEPLSPHLAAQRAGDRIDLAKIESDFIRIYQQYDYLIVEGCGGIVCPLRYDEEKILLKDLILKLNMDILIVSEAKLGSINDAALTAYYAAQQRIHVSGIILNRYKPRSFMEKDNQNMIASMTGVPITACVEEGAQEHECEIESLLKCFKTIEL